VPLAPSTSSHRFIEDPIRLLTDGQPLHLRRERDHSIAPDTVAVCTSATGATVGYFDPVYARVLAPLMDTDGLPALVATYIASDAYGSEGRQLGLRVRVRAGAPRAARPVE
jgi:HIRAN domain-containing protein